MEDEVKSRMQLVLREFSTNPTKLANEFGVNQKTLNSHINGDTAVSLSTILLILKAIPSLSAEWLLRGEGEMLKIDEPTSKDKELVSLSRELVNVIGKIMDHNK